MSAWQCVVVLSRPYKTSVYIPKMDSAVCVRVCVCGACVCELVECDDYRRCTSMLINPIAWVNLDLLVSQRARENSWCSCTYVILCAHIYHVILYVSVHIPVGCTYVILIVTLLFGCMHVQVLRAYFIGVVGGDRSISSSPSWKETNASCYYNHSVSNLRREKKILFWVSVVLKMLGSSIFIHGWLHS